MNLILGVVQCLMSLQFLKFSASDFTVVQNTAINENK